MFLHPEIQLLMKNEKEICVFCFIHQKTTDISFCKTAKGIRPEM